MFKDCDVGSQEEEKESTDAKILEPPSPISIIEMKATLDDDLMDSESRNAISSVTAGCEGSDTSEVIRSCVCGGFMTSRDCIMCDSSEC